MSDRPEDWVLVPKALTERMRSEGETAASFGIGRCQDDEAIARVWEWMLAAAPKPDCLVIVQSDRELLARGEENVAGAKTHD